MSKKKSEITIDVVKTSYALYGTKSSFDPKEVLSDDELHCAWCHKTVTEIGRDKLDKHLEDHEKKDV